HLQVGPAQHAVLGHVGDDIACAAVRIQPLQDLPEVAAVGDPPASPEAGFAVDDANVEADGDAITVAGDGRRAPVRVLERGGAQVDAGAAGRERGLERVVVTDAPGHLDLDVEGADDLGEQVTVGAATERGVEVHQVDPLGAVGLPLQGGV